MLLWRYTTFEAVPIRSLYDSAIRFSNWHVEFWIFTSHNRTKTPCRISIGYRIRTTTFSLYYMLGRYQQVLLYISLVRAHGTVVVRHVTSSHLVSDVNIKPRDNPPLSWLCQQWSLMKAVWDKDCQWWVIRYVGVLVYNATVGLLYDPLSFFFPFGNTLQILFRDLVSIIRSAIHVNNRTKCLWAWTLTVTALMSSHARRNQRLAKI